MMWFGELGGVSDGVTLRGDAAGRIAACLQDENNICLLVDLGVKVSALSAHSSAWSMTSTRRSMWHMREVQTCAAWQVKGEQVTVILM